MPGVSANSRALEYLVGPTVSAIELVGQALLGALIGAVLGGIGRLLGRIPALGQAGWIVSGPVGLAVGAGAGALAVAATANALLAVFVSAILLATGRRFPASPGRQVSRGLSQALQGATFLLIGILVATAHWRFAGWAVAAFVALAFVLARPLAIAASFLGSNVRSTERLFIAWFGPKAVASVLYALVVLHSAMPDRRLVYHVTLVAVVVSVLVHGLTDHPGASLIARSSSARARSSPGSPDDQRSAST